MFWPKWVHWQDEMLRQNRSSEKEIQYFRKILNSIYTMDRPNINICSIMETPIGPKRVKDRHIVI